MQEKPVGRLADWRVKAGLVFGAASVAEGAQSVSDVGPVCEQVVTRNQVSIAVRCA